MIADYCYPQSMYQLLHSMKYKYQHWHASARVFTSRLQLHGWAVPLHYTHTGVTVSAGVQVQVHKIKNCYNIILEYRHTVQIQRTNNSEWIDIIAMYNTHIMMSVHVS